jgi:alpha-L-fucosidase
MLFRRALFSAAVFIAAAISAKAQPGPYTPDWPSLQRHGPVPEWMRDAKFGIYCHWGIYSVPAYGSEHYSAYIYDHSGYSKFGAQQRQIALYGPLEKVGYHDFIPRFRGERFDAAEWADLFRKAGARFAGPVAEHHDGFAMWDSALTPFNAKAMGPHRDVVGELEQAIRARGMKFLVTLHHATNDTNVTLNPTWAGATPAYAKLYGSTMARDEWLALWEAKCVELVDKYHPDIIYHDIGLDKLPDPVKQRYLAHFFNDAAGQGRQVIVVYKHNDLPPGVGMLDHESGHPNGIVPQPWLCDYTVGTGLQPSWGYVEGMELRRPADLLHTLIEVVANNGQMLLNLSPKSDGTIPDDQRKVALKLGEWLWSFGDAIYGTRPFAVASEDLGGGRQVFYTRKDRWLYAIFPDWPGKGAVVTLRQLTPARLGKKVASVELLGARKLEPWPFTSGSAGLALTVPNGSGMPSEMAAVVRIRLN